MMFYSKSTLKDFEYEYERFYNPWDLIPMSLFKKS